ncbi:MAG TPA: agmatinase, partial [Thermoplasmatales archaeon]|nr:agmatinase [Thermoplasmatales archaeon]
MLLRLTLVIRDKHSTLGTWQGFVQKIVINDKFPVAIGGEHSFTPGVVRAVTERYNDVGVLFLDAHLDFREVYEN